MKSLANFHPGKTTQERMIVERFLRNNDFLPDSVHTVLSVIHESVYTITHDHIRLKKAKNADEALTHARVELPEETDDTLYRYCGAALHRMFKLRKETLAGKKGRGELSEKRRPSVEKEIEILQIV